jgi:HAMP domain-containing protein
LHRLGRPHTAASGFSATGSSAVAWHSTADFRGYRQPIATVHRPAEFQAFDVIARLPPPPWQSPAAKGGATVESMGVRHLPLYWRVFAVNAGLLILIALLLIITPVTVSAPIATVEAIVVVAGLLITLLVNALLLRTQIAPLERLAERMDSVDLLHPEQRLRVDRDDEVGRVVRAFNHMLDRLENERRESGRRVLAAQEAERLGIARDLHDDLRPEMLEHLGLTSALTELTTTFARVSGVRVERRFDSSLPET